jgi:endonuclease YncB( thermonuclease family)
MLIFFILNFLYAADCPHGSDRFNCVEFVRAKDGDTIVVDIPGVHSYFGSKADVRLFGIDTPESRSKDSCEVRLSRIARKMVESNLKHAKRIDLKLIANKNGKMRKEKYGRMLADVVYDGKSLTDSLLAQSLGVRYEGKKKAKTNWCTLGAKYLK